MYSSRFVAVALGDVRMTFPPTWLFFNSGQSSPQQMRTGGLSHEPIPPWTQLREGKTKASGRVQDMVPTSSRGCAAMLASPRVRFRHYHEHCASSRRLLRIER